MKKQIKIQCPFCGKKHEVNPGSLMAKLSYQNTTNEERIARVQKAIKARKQRAKERRKLSTGKA